MITKKQFKQLRQQEGSISGLMLAMIRSGIPTVKAHHVLQDLMNEHNVREIEKASTKELFKFVEAFVMSYKNQKSRTSEFILN